MKIMSNQKGFTLLEMMVVVGISAILSYCIFLALRAGDEQRQAVETKMTVHDSGREGLYKMIQEIRLSAPNRVTIAGGNSSITFSIPNPAQPVDNNYQVDWTNALVVQYSLGGLNNQQVIRTVGGTTTVIANNVTALQFTGNVALNPNIVTVSMSLQRATAGNRTIMANPLTVIGQAELRNP
jgi:prepilin-type N-terminal cleavage/methylation domain-containing protein